MHRLLPVLALGFLLAACAGQEPYTQQDLVQVRGVYRTLAPTYRTFRAAYLRNDFRTMRAAFATEQRVCRVVDQIDRRDTISPNVQLFVASEGLDNMCNSIEYAYASWRHDHHLPYNESLQLGAEADLFVRADASLEQMPAELRHPSAPV
jgi:hypothetical protein